MTSPARIGVDEAGLGPKLGPLVLGAFATVSDDENLRRVLASAIGEPGCKPPLVEVGDSKKIHTGKFKLARIERTVLATVAWTHGRLPRTTDELLDMTALPLPYPAEDRAAPWYSDLAESLPVAADRAEIETLALNLQRVAKSAGVHPVHYALDLYPATRINRELESEDSLPYGSKNTWATHTMLRSVRHALDQTPGEATAWCDKAGGRQAYLQPLHRAFEGARIRTKAETRARSVYEITRQGRVDQVGFLLGGDREDPRISWASCLAKYARELVMRALNRHFHAAVDGLARTAGYPEDARRFVREVREAGADVDLPERIWIRAK